MALYKTLGSRNYSTVDRMLTKLSFIPVQSKAGIEGRETSEGRVKSACTRVVVTTAPSTPSSSTPEARAVAPPAAQSTLKVEPAVPSPAALPTSQASPDAQ
jgi:hypothetical protein